MSKTNENTQKENQIPIWKIQARNNHVLFELFQKKLGTVYKSDNRLNNAKAPEKELAEHFVALWELWQTLKDNNYTEFLRFVRENKEICLQIKSCIDDLGGFQPGHSYIIISKNKEILSNMIGWITLTMLDPQKNYTYGINYQSYDFLELSEELEKKRFKHDDKDDIDIDKLDKIRGDIYFDVVWHPVGLIFPEQEEKAVYGRVNNRMIKHMSSYKNKSMIIFSQAPIPFFEQQIQNGIEKLHVIDLRHVTNAAAETIEME